MCILLVCDGHWFDPHVRQNILSLRFGHENFSTTILSLPLIQEGQLTVTGKGMGIKYCQLMAKEWALSIGGLPRNSVARLTDCARNDLKCVKGP